MSLKIMNADEICEALGISKGTLWELQRRGEFPPAIRVSARRRGWKVEDVESWLDQRRIVREAQS